MNPQEATAAYIDALGQPALDKAAAYTMGNHWLLLWGFLVGALAAWLIVRSGFLDRISARLNAGRPRPNLGAFLVGALFLLAYGLLTLPWDIYAEHVREHAYGRSSQPLSDFLLQAGIGLLLSTILGGLFITGLYALIRRAGRRWWLWASGLVAGTLAFILLLSPIAIEPLFNDYKPLPAGDVRNALEQQAALAGVPADRIFVYDGSRQSNNFTANVSGVFGSARIAISDVALKGASLDEVRAVTGHEIGHYVLGHVWRTVLLLTALCVLFFYLVDRLFPAFARLFGSKAALADPAGLPVLFFMGSLFGLVLTPILNANTRVGEREADRYSLETVKAPPRSPAPW